MSSPLTIFTMAVNFTLGAGVLGLPFAMAKAGILASALSLVIVACVSMLTSSWLLEVCDRANAVQNELALLSKGRPLVQHADGTTSLLAPASPFCRPPSSALSEPLLERSERKLDEYRAAYRSWRTGSSKGARDSDLRKLMPLLVYQASKHRELLPLQLLPPPRPSFSGDEVTGPDGGHADTMADDDDDDDSDDDEVEEEAAKLEQALPPAGSSGLNAALGVSTTNSSAANSSQSLSALSTRGPAGASERIGPARSKRPRSLKRTGSFSVDLAAALLALPAHRLVSDNVSPGDDANLADGAAQPAAAESVEQPPSADIAAPPRRASDPIPSEHHTYQPPHLASPPAATPPAASLTKRNQAQHALASPPSALAPSALAPSALGPSASAWQHASLNSHMSYQPDWSTPSEISALEVAQLCTLFLGWRMRAYWIGSILCLHVAAMWTCCAVWVTCAHAVLGGGSAQWYLSAPVLLGACAAVFVPLAVGGGTSVVQPPLAVATLGTLTLMILILFWALLASGDSDFEVFQRRTVTAHSVAISASAPAHHAVHTVSTNGSSIHPYHGSQQPRADNITPLVTETDNAAAFHRLIFNAPAFGPAFSTFIFSYIVQQSVPTLQRAAAQPRATRACLAAAISTCCALYLLLGCSAATLFGDGTAKIITLNWADFRGGAARGAQTPLWARLIGRWVLLLPMLTTTAAFPLFNNVLASNLAALLPPRLRSRRVAAALCSLPPLAGCACVRDTSFLFALCGLSGFTVVFFVPAALQHAALLTSTRRWGEAGRRTPHSTCLSGTVPVLAVLGCGGVAFAYNAWMLLLRPALSALLNSESRA